MGHVVRGSVFALVAVSCLLPACGRRAGVAGSGTGGGLGGFDGGVSTGSAGSGAGGQPVVDPASIRLDGSPIYTRMQRLTNRQWERAVTDVLRFAAPANLSQSFSTPSTTGATDFSNNEKHLFVDQKAAVDFETASEAASALATGSADALVRVYAGTDVEGFVRVFGRRVFRRPLSSDEEVKYQGIFALGEKLYGAGFANGAALVIRAMLQSPKFLYRSELGPSGATLDGYEIASKLSFWLLGTTPSDDLLDAAAAGGLDSIEGIEREARAMLERPEAVEVMRDFHGQLYGLDRYADAETSYRFFDAIFSSGEGLRAILTSTGHFADSSRSGFFMQVPFLVLGGRDDGPDTIFRGAAVADEVLCLDLPGHATPVPALPPLAAGQSNRARIETLTADCGACHRDVINPLGFAFEAFDGFGQRRALDNGVAVDSTGRYAFEDGVRAFADAGDLMRILADGAQAHTCYAKMLAGYALQRDVVENDRPLLKDLAAASRVRSLKEMVISLVKNSAFRMRAEGMP
jgi:hypothetical protein